MKILYAVTGINLLFVLFLMDFNFLGLRIMTMWSPIIPFAILFVLLTISTILTLGKTKKKLGKDAKVFSGSCLIFVLSIIFSILALKYGNGICKKFVFEDKGDVVFLYDCPGIISSSCYVTNNLCFGICRVKKVGMKMTTNSMNITKKRKN